MQTADFDFQFPKGLIAAHPAAQRDQSRLMVLERAKKTINHRYFYNIIDYLKPGDLLVLNNTKVIPANLMGVKEEGGAKVEVLLAKLRSQQNGIYIWECLVKPGKRLNIGSRVIFDNGKLTGVVLDKLANGEQIIQFFATADFWQVLNEIGQIPLPPYISKQLPKDATYDQVDRYQTVYAASPGASAAPTAGLHFTPELLQTIAQKDVSIAYLTLHTGLATFLPVRAENICDHVMHREYFRIPAETIKQIKQAKRVIAVGTTSVRALETMGAKECFEGESDLFIYPGYKFKIVDAMITNFHWPRSTLVMLVAAFAGREFTLEAYQRAIENKYRLFSFGDAMLIL